MKDQAPTGSDSPIISIDLPESDAAERHNQLNQVIIDLQKEIKDQKKTTEDLKFNYDQLSFHIENLPLARIEWDNESHAKSWSKRAEEIFGWTASEFIAGHKLGLSYVYDEDLPLVLNIFRDLTSGKVERNTVESRYMTKDGRIIWCEWFNSIIRDDHGNVVTIMSLVQDITERKKEEQQKEFEQREKEALINTTDDLIWSVSKDYKLIAGNNAFIRRVEELTGFTVKPGDYLMAKEAFSEEILSFWNAMYSKALSGISFRYEVFNAAQNDSDENWGETSFNPIYQDKKVVAFTCYSRDITERKRAEERIRQSEANMAEAQRLANLGNWDYDINQDKLSWSDELYNVFGTNKTIFKVTFDSFLNLVDEKDKNNLLETRRHTLTTGEPFTIEYSITTLKGEKRIILEHGSSQSDKNGKIVCLFGSAQNITYRKKAEEELQLMNEKLRNLSAHLQNTQEHERTTIAREIHDALGQQLTAMKMEVAWLNKKLPDEPQLKEKANGILLMIGDILKTVKRIAVGLRPGILDDLGLIAALEWQGQEFEKNTGITFQFHCDCPTFNPDRYLSTHIFRISQEALTNVARHAQASKIEMTLETTDQMVKLTIRDDGQGFDVEETKNTDSLGLIGMNERALMLMGTLLIESEKSKGTVITLSVPLTEENKIES